MFSLKKIFFGKPHEPEYEKDTVTVSGAPDGVATVTYPDQYAVEAFSRFMPHGLADLPQNEKNAIEEYRRLSLASEVDEAVQEIVNETFHISQDFNAIKLDFHPDCEFSKNTQEKIKECFNYVYHTLFDFDNNGAALFRQFYIDGRLFVHKVLSKNKKKIAKLQRIDALQIRRIRDTIQDYTGLVDLSTTSINYYYTPKQINLNNLWVNNFTPKDLQNIIKFPEQSIAYCDSGYVHNKENYILGFLHKAIIPYNNMKMMEDALVIYRVVRAPSRRVFYVGVKNMPKSKGEQLLTDTMNRFKNRMTYDTNTGLVADRRNILSMIEDIWLTRDSDGNSTEVTTLDDGQQLGVTEDVQYCKDKFYRALNIPKSRFSDEQNPFTTGRVTEITRDEYRFSKFIMYLRSRFMTLVEDVFRTELTLEGIIKDSEWYSLKQWFVWKYAEDNEFVQLKQSEILQRKIELLQLAEPFRENYFSKEWLAKNVLLQSDEDINAITKQRDKEGTNDDDNGNDNFDQ